MHGLQFGQGLRAAGGESAQGDFAEYLVFGQLLGACGVGAPAVQAAHDGALARGFGWQAVGVGLADFEYGGAVFGDAHGAETVNGM